MQSPSIKTHIFISGPIRPSEISVRKCILSIRSEFPDAITYLCVWKSDEDTTRLREEVDHFLELEEPDIEEIKKQITVKTLTDNRPDLAITGWPAMCYRMMYGVNKLCEYANPSDDDIIIRIRTDCVFRFRELTRRRIMNSVSYGYITWFAEMSGVSFNDWFGISTYSNFKKGWVFSGMEEYNRILENKHNTEDVIKQNLLRNNVRLISLDMSQTECFILRKDSKGDMYEHFYY
jgi:hypothetical protein